MPGLASWSGGAGNYCWFREGRDWRAFAHRVRRVPPRQVTLCSPGQEGARDQRPATIVGCWSGAGVVGGGEAGDCWRPLGAAAGLRARAHHLVPHRRANRDGGKSSSSTLAPGACGWDKDRGAVLQRQPAAVRGGPGQDLLRVTPNRRRQHPREPCRCAVQEQEQRNAQPEGP